MVVDVVAGEVAVDVDIAVVLLVCRLVCCLIVDALELLARRASGVSPTHQKFLKEKYFKTKQ